MPTMGQVPVPPLAATMDLQYRLPPFQQIIYTPTILVSVILIIVALLVVLVLYHRSQREARRQKRLEDLQLAKKLLLKRGGTDDDYLRMEHIFKTHPRIDPAAAVMVQDVFHNVLWPLLVKTYGKEFTLRMEKLYFPPPKDTNAIAREKNLQKLVESTKNVAENQAVAAMIDLMDATLKPGAVLRLTFEGVEGGYECLVMNHNMQCLNVTLPANNASLLGALRPGMTVEGNFESGPSLMAFTSTVQSVVGGSMPFARLSVWRNAWEVRKREAVRLGISLDVDFQHISTAASVSIRMSQLEKEMGAVRPGRLVDLSLGGGGLETPSNYTFSVGDFIRFTTALIPGHPSATLLGAIVDVRDIDPVANNGMVKHLGIQFLALDDVSQRLLARAMRQLQEVSTRNEWFQAQRLLEQMRRNNVQEVADVSQAAGTRTEGSRVRPKAGGSAPKTTVSPKTAVRGTTIVRNSQASPPGRVTDARPSPSPGTRPVTPAGGDTRMRRRDEGRG